MNASVFTKNEGRVIKPRERAQMTFTIFRNWRQCHGLSFSTLLASQLLKCKTVLANLFLCDLEDILD